MTLDEWKAQRQAQMLQPQYNTRKAGEGEDNGKWADKMVKLDRKVEDNSGLKKEGDAKKDDGKKKQVLDIEFHFNDGRRGGLGRRGPPNGTPGDRDRKQNRPRRPRENENAPSEGATDGGQRRQRRQRFPRAEGQSGQNAPKVDDIRAFPSLG